MKVHHICRYEVGSRPRSRWEEKEFPTKAEAEKFAFEWRENHSGGAYTESKIEQSQPTPHDILSSHVVARYAEKAFNSNKIF